MSHSASTVPDSFNWKEALAPWCDPDDDVDLQMPPTTKGMQNRDLVWTRRTRCASEARPKYAAITIAPMSEGV